MLLQTFHNQIFTVGQMLAFEFQGVNLACRILDLEVVELETLRRGSKGEIDARTEYAASKAQRGVLMHQTAIEFTKSSESTIRLKGAKRA